MNKECEIAIEKYFQSGKKYKRILEIGSGFYSTLFMKKKLASIGSGFVYSLEDNEDWYNKLKVYNDQFGEVVLCKVVLDGIVKYDYTLSGIYDIVLIDGPGNDALAQFKSYFLKARGCLKRLRVGSQSMDIMNYIWEYIDNNSIVIVDGRISSMCVFIDRYRDIIKVKSYGKIFSKNTISKLINKNKSICNIRLGPCNTIRKVK